MKKRLLSLIGVGLFAILGLESPSQALDLDWKGQFRAESHWLYNYSLSGADATVNQTQQDAGGYYIPGGGSRDVYFQTLFLRLQPSLVVNDNIYIRSEWWVGDPIYGFFGGDAPFTKDQNAFDSTYSRGSFIRANRVWGEFLSEIGTVIVGRAPLDWGLGINWNDGDGIFDRYQSTGDTIGMISKFGSFSFSPRIIKYSLGNNLGGACADPTSVSGVTGACDTTKHGGGGVSDYSIAMKYDNIEEDLELGLNFIKRIAGSVQTQFYGVDDPRTTVGMNYNVWDIYAKKTFGKFSLAGEIPVTNGTLGGTKYQTFALALEGNWDVSDTFAISVKAGQAPGQPNVKAGKTIDDFKAFYFHPNYDVGLIMFNYQLANFAGPNTQNNSGVGAGDLLSPWDNPITNAKYLNLNMRLRSGKWTFRTNWVFAKANEVASGETGDKFYNYRLRQHVAKKADSGEQSKSLGWEMDYGTTFHWDETFEFHFDVGWYFPGDYWKFSNTSTENTVSSMFATVFKLGINF